VTTDRPGRAREVFRPTRTRAVLLGVGGASAVTFTTVAFAMPAPWTGPNRAVMSCCGLLILAGMLVLARPRLVADPAGLTVVNLVTRRRLAWAEVLRVNLRDGDPWVYLDLADGTSMAAMGIQPGNGRAAAARDAGRLRELVRERGEVDPTLG
jgi:Bacterial PH domain